MARKMRRLPQTADMTCLLGQFMYSSDWSCCPGSRCEKTRLMTMNRWNKGEQALNQNNRNRPQPTEQKQASFACARCQIRVKGPATSCHPLTAFQGRKSYDLSECQAPHSPTDLGRGGPQNSWAAGTQLSSSPARPGRPTLAPGLASDQHGVTRFFSWAGPALNSKLGNTRQWQSHSQTTLENNQ